MSQTLAATLSAKQRQPQADLLHRIDGVMRRTGRSRAWIYAAVRRGEFPSPLKLGLRSVAWRDSDLAAWQSGLTTGIGPSPIRTSKR